MLDNGNQEKGPICAATQIEPITKAYYRESYPESRRRTTRRRATLLRFQIHSDGRKGNRDSEERTASPRVINGQDAQTLSAFIEKGCRGITAWDFGCGFRLSSCIHRLRHEYGLNIETCYEPHEGGRHARYMLHSIVEVFKNVFPE